MYFIFNVNNILPITPPNNPIDEINPAENPILFVKCGNNPKIVPSFILHNNIININIILLYIISMQ